MVKFFRNILKRYKLHYYLMISNDLNKTNTNLKCKYCFKKNEFFNQLTQKKLIEALKTDENDFDVEKELYHYLSLPPLFLTIGRCQHSAADLLLEYAACSNIQDLNDNTIVQIYKIYTIIIRYISHVHKINHASCVLIY
jgi:hypothetical protein